MFRETSYNRYHAVGIKNTDADVLYVGGSAGYCYWEPPKAWAEYGITSYNYCFAELQAEAVRSCLEEALKYQSPQLVLIDVRPFQYYGKEIKGKEIRKYADNMDYSLNRLQLYLHFFRNHVFHKETQDTNIWAYFFDIMKYHPNVDEVLSDEIHWSLIDNQGKAKYNGFEFNGFELYGDQQILPEPSDYQTEEKSDLDEKSKEILLDLVDYCRKKDLKVLFVVCPYYLTKEHQMKYNTIQDIVEENGFDFINTNNLYSDMGIDFATDYHDINHVNCLGAEKYTRYMAEYITHNYQIPCHLEESGFENWDEMYLAFSEEDNAVQEKLLLLIRDRQLAHERRDLVSKTQSIDEWISAANSPYYTVLVTSKEMNLERNCYSYNLYEFLRLTGTIYNGEFMLIRLGEADVFKAQQCLAENYDTEIGNGYFGTVTSYSMNCGEKASIVVNGEECYRDGG